MDTRLTWKDMKAVVDHAHSVVRAAWWHDKKLSEQELFEEVLRRFTDKREKDKGIFVPRWFLEVVENALRIQYNINDQKETGETCQDRNIKQSLIGVRKLLKGEELTGGERLERMIQL